jgi:hypothetical protein
MRLLNLIYNIVSFINIFLMLGYLDIGTYWQNNMSYLIKPLAILNHICNIFV